jgi:dsDNA-specific endonuclease/ATPase MutS2
MTNRPAERPVYRAGRAVVELNNEIRELEYAERREVLRILKEVSGVLRPYLEELLQVFRFLGLIDFIRAKALFAVKIGAVMPVFRDRPLSNGKMPFTRCFTWPSKKRAVRPFPWI